MIIDDANGIFISFGTSRDSCGDWDDPKWIRFNGPSFIDINGLECYRFDEVWISILRDGTIRETPMEVHRSINVGRYIGTIEA